MEVDYLLFTSNMLFSSRQEWLTSGLRDDRGQMIWTSDRSNIDPNTHNFVSDSARDADGKDPENDLKYNRIIYRYFKSKLYFFYCKGHSTTGMNLGDLFGEQNNFYLCETMKSIFVEYHV